MDKDKLKEKLEALAKDEEEAIEGYDKVIDELNKDGDSNILGQLIRIRDEEKAHLEFLNKAKEDPDAKYEDPSDSEPDEGEDLEEKAEREAASIMFNINLRGE